MRHRRRWNEEKTKTAAPIRSVGVTWQKTPQNRALLEKPLGGAQHVLSLYGSEGQLSHAHGPVYILLCHFNPAHTNTYSSTHIHTKLSFPLYFLLLMCLNSPRSFFPSWVFDRCVLQATHISSFLLRSHNPTWRPPWWYMVTVTEYEFHCVISSSHLWVSPSKVATHIL